MTFFIQHGYGKGSKIAQVSQEGNVSGIILSPADEDPAALAATAQDGRNRGLQVMLDPQTYVYAVTPAGSGRSHEANGIDLTDLHWSQSAAATTAQVQAVERANTAIGISAKKIAPTVLQGSFADIWTPLAIQYARTASSEWGAANTLASIAVDDAAFADWRTVEDWLDVATTLDVAGFYLLVDRRRRDYPPLPWDKVRLKNVLRLIYRLSVLNDYEVVWGYSDFEGMLGLAAGADAAATGWSYSLRQFTVYKWQPSPAGGQAPTPRFSLARLWAPVRAEAEAAPLFASDLRDELFGATYVRRFGDDSFASWSRLEAQEQHLRLLARLAQRVVTEGDVVARVDATRVWLESARERLQRASREGIALQPSYLARVENYLGAIDGFAEAETL
jgi:hypothetical protein